MATIKKITDKQGNDIYLRTHTKAVVDDNGYTAESRLKAMQDEINQAQLELGAVPSDLTPTENSSNWVTSGGIYNQLITGDANTEIDLSQYEEVMAIPNPTKWITNSSDYPYYGVFVPITANKQYIIIGNSTNNTYYCFLTSNSYTNNSAVSYATGCTRETVTPNTTVVTDVAPSNAMYMYVLVRYSEEDRKPQDVSIYNKVSLRKMTEDISADVVDIKNSMKVNQEPNLGHWQSSTTYMTVTEGENHNVSVALFSSGRFGFDISKVGSGNILHISYHYEKTRTNSGAWGIGSSLTSTWVNVTPISGSISNAANLIGDVEFSFVVPSGTNYIYLAANNYYLNGTANTFVITNFKAWTEYTLAGEIEKKEAEKKIPNNLTKYKYYGERISVQSPFNFSYEDYMTLSSHMTSSTSQGGASHGEYLFVGSSTGNQLDIYNLSTKSFISHITIEGKNASTQDHCNTIFFGNEFYSSEDVFPILYMCSGYVHSDGMSYVYGCRITLSDGVFSASLVHTIALNFNIWSEAVCDTNYNYLWIRPGDTWYKYTMPLCSNGDATINPGEDIIESFTLPPSPYSTTAQAVFFHNEKIYYTSGTGVSDTNGNHLVVINTNTRCRETDINLTSVGLTGEPQFCIIYEGYLYIGYRNKLVKFYFD